MKLPNNYNAIIEQKKLTDYLLDMEHKRGGSKANLLHKLGYNKSNYGKLREDILYQLATLDITATKQTLFGTQYIIVGYLQTPNNNKRLFRSIWQIDTGASNPRLITIYPE